MGKYIAESIPKGFALRGIVKAYSGILLDVLKGDVEGHLILFAVLLCRPVGIDPEGFSGSSVSTK